MKKHSSGDIGVVQADTNSLHGGQMYAQLAKPSGRGSSSRGRSQSQADMLLQVPMTTTASHRWLEDAITEWQVRPLPVLAARNIYLQCSGAVLLFDLSPHILTPLSPSLPVCHMQTSQGQHMHMGGLAGYTPKQVEEVKMVLRLLPVFAATVLYW